MYALNIHSYKLYIYIRIRIGTNLACSIFRTLPRNLGKMTFLKIEKNNVGGSLLSQQSMHTPKVAGIHGTLCGACCTLFP